MGNKGCQIQDDWNEELCSGCEHKGECTGAHDVSRNSLPLRGAGRMPMWGGLRMAATHIVHSVALPASLETAFQAHKAKQHALAKDIGLPRPSDSGLLAALVKKGLGKED